MTVALVAEVTTTTDDRLFDAARTGDEDAAMALIDRHQRNIAAGLRSAGLSPADAMYEDAQNQALVAIWQQLPSFRGDARLGTWMYSIARNTARSRVIDPEARERRRRQRNFERTPDQELLEVDASDRTADNDLLAQVLARLSPQDREILMLRAGLDLPMHEIAATLFLSQPGVKARYRRARRRAAAIANQLKEPMP